MSHADPQLKWRDLTPIGTIMAVDDSRFDQMLTKRVLDRTGAVKSLLQFQDPEQALAFLQQEERPDIDIILLDVNMPRMSGFEFLEAATKLCGPNFAGCVVVMLTTSLDPADRVRADSFDVVKDYFTKPLEDGDVYRLAGLAQGR